MALAGQVLVAVFLQLSECTLLFGQKIMQPRLNVAFIECARQNAENQSKEKVSVASLRPWNFHKRHLDHTV